jgi:hypothetical protein
MHEVKVLSSNSRPEKADEKQEIPSSRPECKIRVSMKSKTLLPTQGLAEEDKQRPDCKLGLGMKSIQEVEYAVRSCKFKVD